MLVKEWTQDIEMASGKRMTVYLYAPNLKEYPSAKWPGVICFTEIYQNTPPVARFASNIASQGYVVAGTSALRPSE
jgi:carboxymethylenebutenolidase